MEFFARKAREEVSQLLEEGEQIMLVSRQSLMNDIAPAFIIATDHRILIINNSFWGLYFGANIFTPTDFNSIPYDRIMSTVLVKGKLFSSLNMRLLGGFEAAMNPQKKTEGEVDGLKGAEAMRIVKFVESMIKKRYMDGDRETSIGTGR